MRRYFAVVAICLGFASISEAHAVGIDVKLHDGKVTIEAFYDDDTPAPDAKVTVFDAANIVISEGKTDAHGVWKFAAPPTGKYEVRVDAGAGHTAKTTFTIPPVAVETASISDGPDRATFTGPMRWVMAAIGLAAIGSLTFVARWASRRKKASE
jgi:hypothetical protein